MKERAIKQTLATLPSKYELDPAEEKAILAAVNTLTATELLKAVRNICNTPGSCKDCKLGDKNTINIICKFETLFTLTDNDIAEIIEIAKKG